MTVITKVGRGTPVDPKSLDYAAIREDAFHLCQHTIWAGRMQGSGCCFLHLAISTQSLEQMRDAARSQAVCTMSPYLAKLLGQMSASCPCSHGHGHLLHASRLCESVCLASYTLEIMQDAVPNATRPTDVHACAPRVSSGQSTGWSVSSESAVASKLCYLSVITCPDRNTATASVTNFANAQGCSLQSIIDCW